MSETAGGRAAGERFELVATVLLALATVATAWSGYQASRWNGEQAKAFSRASALRIESTKADSLANAQTEVDVQTYAQWIDALFANDTERAAFFRKRFRPEFARATTAWLATRPFARPDAPLTPFAMPEYRLAARADAKRLDAQATVWTERARADVQRATNYVLGVVLFAAALFFAGISTKLEAPALRRAVLTFGVLALVGTLAWIATFPVSVSI